ncbi:uncharacterized protein G2W53_003009 [Senna tora]|uniref:Uncharacterized protein n=1 Tax=Senna tora TaxID=362788 RepID=A0A834X919_9FABA|nr:uncharacterized protein G2W53_003009 [Senna tora]
MESDQKSKTGQKKRTCLKLRRTTVNRDQRPQSSTSGFRRTSDVKNHRQRYQREAPTATILTVRSHRSGGGRPTSGGPEKTL